MKWYARACASRRRSAAAGAPRVLDQLAQRHRRAARLRGQPVPVTQQRDLARHHAELRPAAAALFAAPGSPASDAARASAGAAA
jgi:hypothetical protein